MMPTSLSTVYGLRDASDLHGEVAPPHLLEDLHQSSHRVTSPPMVYTWLNPLPSMSSTILVRSNPTETLGMATHSRTAVVGRAAPLRCLEDQSVAGDDGATEVVSIVGMVMGVGARWMGNGSLDRGWGQGQPMGFRAMIWDSLPNRHGATIPWRSFSTVIARHTGGEATSCAADGRRAGRATE